jgi:hypothetical protein
VLCATAGGSRAGTGFKRRYGGKSSDQGSAQIYGGGQETASEREVTFRATIGTDGLIKDLQVISGPELLRASYLDAVRQWTYRPYLLNGVPVIVETIISLHISV